MFLNYNIKDLKIIDFFMNHNEMNNAIVRYHLANVSNMNNYIILFSEFIDRDEILLKIVNIQHILKMHCVKNSINYSSYNNITYSLYSQNKVINNFNILALILDQLKNLKSLLLIIHVFSCTIICILHRIIIGQEINTINIVGFNLSK